MGNSQMKGVVSEEVDLTHFKLLRSIGRGSFGKVRIVEHKFNKKRYALKYFAKDNLIRRKMCKNIIRERNILVSLNHPFVCNLRFAFQDDFNVYMGLDLMLGGDLRFHLARRKFSQAELIFLAAELSSALGYLHGSGVIHRDIKPDNILLDEKGHAHLTDFNIASYLDPNTKLRSQSGTLQYMAPEVLQGFGYDHRVDWWSLGVTLYECLYGKTPFQDALKRLRRKEAIVTETISWGTPLHIERDSELVKLTQLLLVKDPSQRLAGSIKGSFAVQRAPIFSHIDWELLNKKLVTPPFCPSGVRSNFDMSYDLEELLLEDSPLEALPSRRTVKPNKLSSKLSDDMLYLENSYLVYDYYRSQPNRRHSADFTNSPLTNSSASIGCNPSLQNNSQSVVPRPDRIRPPATSPPPRALRRLSRSLVDLYATNEKPLSQLRNTELSPVIQNSPQVSEPLVSVSSPSSVSSEDYLANSRSLCETAGSENPGKPVSLKLRSKHKYHFRKKSGSIPVSGVPLKFLPPDTSLSLPPTSPSLN